MPFHTLTRLRNLFHPERFQGWGEHRRYFEGWYFKIVNREGTEAFAIIPGIAMDGEGRQHSFVQVLDGKRKTARYHRFAKDDFSAAKNAFKVSIGSNTFSEKGLTLALDGLAGSLQFKGNTPWPKPFYSPGIMGPFTFVPFMECYHGIVSMDHAIEGSLTADGDRFVDFSGGRGYLEKDWGRSFPSAYIWMQTNHFSQIGTSLKCSVANIPWLGSSFVGFIAGLQWQGRLIRFTTYNRSSLISCLADMQRVHISLQNPQYRLDVDVERDAPTALASPILGLMDGRIEETMNAVASIRLSEQNSNRILLEDSGRHCGLEVAGDINIILKSGPSY
jgi:tocopherol cyclase